MAWYSRDWSHRKRVIIDGSKIYSSETDFVVPFIATDDEYKSVSHGGNVASETGEDILFTNSGGDTKLRHELDSYDPVTGKIVAWVKTSNLTISTDHHIYIYYGNRGNTYPRPIKLEEWTIGQTSSVKGMTFDKWKNHYIAWEPTIGKKQIIKFDGPTNWFAASAAYPTDYNAAPWYLSNLDYFNDNLALVFNNITTDEIHVLEMSGHNGITTIEKTTDLSQNYSSFIPQNLGFAKYDPNNNWFVGVIRALNRGTSRLRIVRWDYDTGLPTGGNATSTLFPSEYQDSAGFLDYENEIIYCYLNIGPPRTIRAYDYTDVTVTGYTYPVFELPVGTYPIPADAFYSSAEPSAFWLTGTIGSYAASVKYTAFTTSQEPCSALVNQELPVSAAWAGTDFTIVDHMNIMDNLAEHNSTGITDLVSVSGLIEADIVAGLAGNALDLEPGDIKIYGDNNDTQIEGPITVEAVFKSGATPSDNMILASKFNNDTNEGWYLYVNDQGNLGFAGKEGGVLLSAVSSGTYLDGNWHYAAGRKSGNTYSIIVDDVEYIDNTQGQGGSVAAAGASLEIGDITSVPGDFGFSGIIDEVRISPVARSDEWLHTTYDMLLDGSVVPGPTDPGETPSGGDAFQDVDCTTGNITFSAFQTDILTELTIQVTSGTISFEGLDAYVTTPSAGTNLVECSTGTISFAGFPVIIDQEPFSAEVMHLHFQLSEDTPKYINTTDHLHLMNANMELKQYNSTTNLSFQLESYTAEMPVYQIVLEFFNRSGGVF